MSSSSSTASRIRRIPWWSIFSDLGDRALLVFKTACCVHVINNYLVSVVLPRGPSMIPTMNLAGDIVLMDRFTPRWGKVEVGDVVLVRSPEDPRKVVCKRVLGLEGDSVTYLADPAMGTRTESVVVPKGHVWVQGDNIYDSRDSRQFGPAPYGLIQGKVFLRVWPPKEFGSIQRNV